MCTYFFSLCDDTYWGRYSSLSRLHNHTQTHHIQPVAETSTSHHKKTQQTSKSPAGFETAIPTNKRPQTHALDRAGTVISLYLSHIIPSYIFLVLATWITWISSPLAPTPIHLQHTLQPPCNGSHILPPSYLHYTHTTITAAH